MSKIINFIGENKRIFRKMGFYKDQNGIINRYLRETDNWDTHLNETKRFIEQNIPAKTKSAIVLGSGWLLDVPYDILLRKFDKVFFVDINHPKQILKKFKNTNNAYFVYTDITGMAAEIYRKTKDKSASEIFNINAENSNLTKLISDADFIISVNILNQLDIIICDFLLRKKYTYNMEILRKIIQTNHIKLLPPKKSLLITDYEELTYDSKGNNINKKKLIYTDIPNFKTRKEWIWIFDTHRTYNPPYITQLKVCALKI